MARQKKEEEQMDTGAWMATYADLVTLLMCLFVLLFAMSNLDESKFEALASSFAGSSQNFSIMDGGDGITGLLGNGIMEIPDSNQGVSAEEIRTQEEKENAKAKQELEKMASDFKTYLGENDLLESVGIEVTQRYIMLNLPESVLFDSGSAEIKQAALPILQIISDALSKYENSEVEIEGHADNRPINTIQYKNNWYLSSARATEVGSYLVDRGFISPERIITIGYGEYKPVDTNETPEGRAKNRRVEIKITNQYFSENK